MRVDEFRASVRSSHALLRDMDLIQHAREFDSLVPSEATILAAQNPNSSYVDLYRTALSAADYNLLLADYSFFQFAYSGSGGQFGLRIAYYPNPFDISGISSTLAEIESITGEEDWENFYLDIVGSARELIRAPLIRYDLSFSQYRELLHPAAHFHFGLNTGDRWPVSLVVTPLLFTLLIAKLFYGKAWDVVGSDGAKPPEANWLDTRFSTEKTACRPVDERFFSRRERGQVFVG